MPKKVFLFGSYLLSTYQPETTAYLTALAVPNDSTVYYSGTAQQILGSGIWTALDTFVVSLKNTFTLTLGTNNLSTKFPAIYPMIGGTATAHKYNLCNPLDTNGAFRLTFSGGWTHSATGAKPNGTNAWADSYVVPNTSLSLNSSHISYYSRTNSSGTPRAEMGVAESNKRLFLLPRYNATETYRAVNSSQLGATNLVSNSQAMFTASRNNSSNMQLYRNKTLVISDTQSSGALSTLKIYVGAYNAGGFESAWTDRECGFASIGVGMDATLQGLFYDAVQQLETSLFRQI